MVINTVFYGLIYAALLVILVPVVKVLAQFNLFRMFMYHTSILAPIPVPFSYGKWGVFAMWLLVVPVKVRSTKSPWELGSGDVEVALHDIRRDPKYLFVFDY